LPAFRFSSCGISQWNEGKDLLTNRISLHCVHAWASPRLRNDVLPTHLLLDLRLKPVSEPLSDILVTRTHFTARTVTASRSQWSCRTSFEPTPWRADNNRGGDTDCLSIRHLAPQSQSSLDKKQASPPTESIAHHLLLSCDWPNPFSTDPQYENEIATIRCPSWHQITHQTETLRQSTNKPAINITNASACGCNGGESIPAHQFPTSNDRHEDPVTPSRSGPKSPFGFIATPAEENVRAVETQRSLETNRPESIRTLPSDASSAIRWAEPFPFASNTHPFRARQLETSSQESREALPHSHHALPVQPHVLQGTLTARTHSPLENSSQRLRRTQRPS